MNSADKHTYKWLSTKGPVFSLERAHSIATLTEAVDVTGPFWVMGAFRIKSGSISFLNGIGQSSPAAGSYLMWLPPGSVMKAKLVNLVQSGVIHIGIDRPAVVLPNVSSIVEIKKFSGYDDYETILKSLPKTGWATIGFGQNADPLASRVRKLLDKNFRQTNLLLSQIAKKLNCSTAHMSRKFAVSYERGTSS